MCLGVAGVRVRVRVTSEWYQYTLIDPPLPLNGSGEGAYLWMKMVPKGGSENAAKETNHLLRDIARLKRSMEEHPEGPSMAHQLENAVERLRIVREKEIAQGSEVASKDPIVAARELMALSDDEMDRWVRVFRRFDVQEAGSFTVDYFFRAIDSDLNAFAMDLFTSADALNDEEEVEFGDFMKVISTYCFFGLDEVLKALFVFCDTDHAGFLTAQQFCALVNMLNGHKRLSKSWYLDTAPDSSYRMYYEQFKECHHQHPLLLHPAFLLQQTLRVTTMGEEWWLKKLIVYKAVRERVSGNLSAYDKQADLEVQPFKEDAERVKRMATRAEDMRRSEGSPVRLALLQARQFLDEFS